MQKSIIYYGIAILVLLSLGTVILFNAKNLLDSSKEDIKLSPEETNSNAINDLNQDDSSSSTNTSINTENQKNSDGNSGGDTGGATSSGSTSDAPLVSNSPSNSVSFCGVSNQFDISNINLKSSLNEAQKVILECMSSSLSNCLPKKMQLISNVGNPDSVYEIKGYENNTCIIEGTDSSFSLKSCSFSKNAIDALIIQAEKEYPLIPASKFFKIIEIVNSDGGIVELSNGNNETVICT